MFHAIILGIVQGITEFLPISSSGHLLLIPYLLHWQPFGLSFDVALHLGTLLAVLIYFFATWRDLIVKGLFERKKKEAQLLWLIILATIPAALIGVVAQSTIEDKVRQPSVFAVMLILFGIILWAADRYSLQEKEVESLGWKDALTIGFSQALALIPGVSRSGITMTSGLMRGLTREEAARFSFLLIAPITLGAVVTQIGKVGHTIALSTVVAGVATSFIVGMITIHYMLKYIRRYGFAPYLWYRLLFGAFVLLVVAHRR